MAKTTRSKTNNAAASGGGGGAPASASIPVKVADTLYQEFEDLGLTPYQARLVVALQQAGSANCVDLGRLAGIPRTSVYQVVEDLGRKGLAARVPGSGPAVWASVGRREVLDRLVALEGERLDAVKGRAKRVGEQLKRLLPTDRTVPLPYVQVIHDPSRVSPLYQQLLRRTEDELLVFNRPPYTELTGPAEPAVAAAVAAAARRARARVLYQSAQAVHADYESWHDEMDQCQKAGVKGRVVDELPIKLAIFDRRCTLLTLDDPVLPLVGFPITLLIEHPGYSSMQADVFEKLWTSATPYAEIHRQLQATRRSNPA